MLLIMCLFFGFVADVFTLSANTSMHFSNDLNAIKIIKCFLETMLTCVYY